MKFVKDKNIVAEKWLQEHTRKCPIGRIAPQMCERLRARPQIKDTMETDRLMRPLVCVNCRWWEYFGEAEERKVAA